MNRPASAAYLIETDLEFTQPSKRTLRAIRLPVCRCSESQPVTKYYVFINSIREAGSMSSLEGKMVWYAGSLRLFTSLADFNKLTAQRTYEDTALPALIYDICPDFGLFRWFSQFSSIAKWMNMLSTGKKGPVSAH